MVPPASSIGPCFRRNSRDIAAKRDATKLAAVPEEGFAMYVASTSGGSR